MKRATFTAIHALNWHFMICIVLPLEVIPFSLEQLGNEFNLWLLKWNTVGCPVTSGLLKSVLDSKAVCSPRIRRP